MTLTPEQKAALRARATRIQSGAASVLSNTPVTSGTR